MATKQTDDSALAANNTRPRTQEIQRLAFAIIEAARSFDHSTANWGDVGDLGYVLERLEEAASHIGVS